MHPIDHEVSKYAIDVIEGRVVAGDLVRMACERHLIDLETARDRGFVFDCGKASAVIKTAGLLTHNAGPLSGQRIRLEPWQMFRHGSVYGWVDAETGLRRFRKTYHQVGKKNGKTTDTAVPLIYSQLFDGEGSPEAYCAATSRDQAGILFNGVKKMIQKSPELAQIMRPWVRVIETPPTGGIVKAVSRESSTADGVNPSFLARDEMHRWTDRELAETLVESMIARAQPIDWVITTAGHDIGGLCGELRIHAENVLRGSVVDDEFFAYVAEPARDCDPFDPVSWQMGNPNLGVSKPLSAVEAAAKTAAVISGQMPNFRRFHLDLWTETAETWISRDDWDRGLASAPFDMSELFGLPAWVALDLSQKKDTTSICIAVPKDGATYLISYTFLPCGPSGFLKRAQAENKNYIDWRDRGFLEVHNGGAIDEEQILKRLVWIRDKFDLQELAYDRWGMQELAKKLDKLRFPLVEHGQGFRGMSEPMKAVEIAVIDGKLRHGGNPVLGWQVGNVAFDEDKAGNLSPNKKRATGRIDAAVAMIMAVGRANVGAVKRRRREVDLV